MATKTHGGIDKKKVMAGVGLAALAAAAAGAAFLYGTEAGRRRRKEIKSWSLRMKADVLDRIANMKDWSEDTYNKAVSEVAKKYKGMKNIEAAELAALVSSLRSHWKTIKRQVEAGSKPQRRTTRRTRRTTRKTA